MNVKMSITDIVDFDVDHEINKIITGIRDILRMQLHKRGLIIAMSGGIDSSVCAALAVKALGKDKVFGLLLPEHDSSQKVTGRGKTLADFLGLDFIEHNIAPTLEAIGCYEWRDSAIRNIFPEYTNEWKNKIVITGGLQGKINHFKLVVQSPEGDNYEKRLPLKEYLQIVAATNYKQRIRKSIEYFHADRLNYAVIGTPNRLEYDQGFFVKNGDGSADIKPIAHLYKTHVYTIAKHLGLPEDICNAVPTTDTYSLSQGQDEFYFALPYQQMDIALWAHNNQIEVEKLSEMLDISVDQVIYIYTDIEIKRKTTAYLHSKAKLIENVSEITV